MNNTIEILNKLQVDKNLVKLVSGEIGVPYIEDDFQSTRKFWHPHPPVLVPMFARYDFSYYGILKHWFVDRQETFIEFTAEWGFMLEYARNAKQFFAQMILNMIMIEENLDDRILEFANAVDFDNPQKIDQFTEEYGDDSAYFSELQSFADDMPLTYLKKLENYRGDYPSSERLFNKSVIDNACSFEIAKKEYLAGLDDVPEWLDENIDKKLLFDRFVQEDNLSGAWLTLNSGNITFSDVAGGLKTLKSKTDDSTFHLIADNWIDGWQNSNFNK